MIRARLSWHKRASADRILGCGYGVDTFQESVMDRDVLMHQMTERFQELYNRVLDALDRAPDGQWIAASEWAFRDAFVQLMKERD